jgi:hypothetical protein
MQNNECVVGARVICVLHGHFNGCVGYIGSVVRSANGEVDTYNVVDDNGNNIGTGTSWIWLSSWDIYEVKDPNVPIKIIKLKECPCGIDRSDCTYHRN